MKQYLFYLAIIFFICDIVALKGCSLKALVRPVVLFILLLLAYFYLPLDMFGMVFFAASAIFYFFPEMFYKKAMHALSAGNYKEGIHIASLLRTINPFPDTFQFFEYCQKIGLIAEGKVELLTELNEKTLKSRTKVTNFLKPELCIIQADYKMVLQEVDELSSKRNTTFSYMRWQALGELGRREQLIEEASRLPVLLHPATKAEDARSLIFLAAYTGNSFLWDIAKEQAFTLLTDVKQRILVITYDFVRFGNKEKYERELSELLKQASPIEQKQIENRLATSFIGSDAKPLSSENQALLEIVVQKFKDSIQPTSGKKNAATYTVLALITVTVLVQWLTIFPYADLMQYYAALVLPAELASGNYWRVLSICFASFSWGALFFALPVFSLFPRVEYQLGRLKLVFIYMASGLGTLGLNYWIWFNCSVRPLVSLGAGSTAAVLGVMGAMGALGLQANSKDKTKLIDPAFGYSVFIFMFKIILDFVNFRAPEGLLGWDLTGYFIGFSLVYLLKNGQVCLDKSICTRVLHLCYCWMIVAGCIFTFSHYKRAMFVPHSAQDRLSTTHLEMMSHDRRGVFDWYVRSALLGNSNSQLRVSQEFSTGGFVQKNTLAANYWLKKSTGKNN